jgi:hypothetical protein
LGKEFRYFSYENERKLPPDLSVYHVRRLEKMAELLKDLSQDFEGVIRGLKGSLG